MPQLLPIQITEIQVTRFTVDPEAHALTVDYTEGNSNEGTYTPLRTGSRTIEGEALRELYSLPIYDSSGAQLNLYEVIRSLVYKAITA